MKRSGWLAGVLAAALSGAAVSGALAAPRILVERPIHEFGTVEQGTPVDHVFAVRNAGDAPLRIEHVKGSCACTVGSADTGRELPPGDSAWVTVRLDTARIAGRTAKTITVLTNDPAQPSQPLTLSGTVVTDLVLSPSPLYVGHVRRGQVVRREVRIAPGRSDARHLVRAVEATTPAVRARIEPGAEPDTQMLVVEIDPVLEAGRFDDVVRLRTTSTRQPWIELPVFGMVETEVAVLPSQVTFGIDRTGVAAAHDVRIRNRSRRPMAVTRVNAPEPVDYELTTVREGVEYRLTLRLRGELPEPEGFEGQVEVFTDHPAEGRIVVPVYAIDRG